MTHQTLHVKADTPAALGQRAAVLMRLNAESRVGHVLGTAQAVMAAATVLALGMSSGIGLSMEESFKWRSSWRVLYLLGSQRTTGV